MESLTPNIFVKNIQQTVDFYRLLGFEVSMQVPDHGEMVWCMMSNGSVNLMFQTFESLGIELPQISRDDGGSLLLYIKLNNIIHFYEHVQKHINILKPVEKTFYGATEFSVLDPNNYVITFAEDIQESST